MGKLVDSPGRPRLREYSTDPYPVALLHKRRELSIEWGDYVSQPYHGGQASARSIRSCPKSIRSPPIARHARGAAAQPFLRRAHAPQPNTAPVFSALSWLLSLKKRSLRQTPGGSVRLGDVVLCSSIGPLPILKRWLRLEDGRSNGMLEI